jgi:hypothetical protein
MIKFIIFLLGFFMVTEDGVIFMPLSFSAERITTKVVVRVTSKDAKVIGSGVGGAFVRIKNMETGEVLAQGKQLGGTGETDRLMIQPRRRGETLYGVAGTAFFQAEIPLEKSTAIEIHTEAPLGYPHAIQKGSKTLTLIPGKHILGDGVIIELNGLIVNAISPSSKKSLKRGEEIDVRVEVKML